MREHHWQEWDSESEQRLRELAAAGATIEVIAAELGRTQGAIGTKALKLGLSVRSRDRGLRRRFGARRLIGARQ
jgi:hypothetical protein